MTNNSYAPVLSFLFAAVAAAETAFSLPFRSQDFVVASPSPYSAAVAAEVAQAGGNTFDQAIAIEFALAVTHPYYASIGGGGFAMIRKSNAGGPPTVEVVDFRETAPQALSRLTFVENSTADATKGGMASGVPGVIAGLSEMHRKYGKVAWPKLLVPAIRLAEKGFPVSGEWADLTAGAFEEFNASGKKIFGRLVLDKSKPPVERFEQLKPGDKIKQPKLAKALKLIQKQGAKGFYEGALAKDIVNSVGAAGGQMSLADLKNYMVAWREPIKRSWRGYDIHLMPLPSSGGLIMAQGYEILDRIEKKFGANPPLSAGEAHLWAETLKLSFAARSRMGDPMASDLQAQLIKKYLAPERFDRLARLVDDDQAIAVQNSRSPDLKEALTPAAPSEKEQTTHFSVADRDGNAVAFTVTLNGVYGSGVVSDGFGIAMNDEIDDFNTVPGKPNQFGLIQGEANAIEPGKRPLSSMSPTIIDKDGTFFASLGAPGGPRIASAVWQTSVRLMTQDKNAEDAIAAPRVHHQFLPDITAIDGKRMSPDVVERLKSFGHKPEDATIAKVYVVKRLPSGLLEAAADSRGEAAAGGR